MTWCRSVVGVLVPYRNQRTGDMFQDHIEREVLDAVDAYLPGYEGPFSLQVGEEEARTYVGPGLFHTGWHAEPTGRILGFQLGAHPTNVLAPRAEILRSVQTLLDATSIRGEIRLYAIRQPFNGYPPLVGYCIEHLTVVCSVERNLMTTDTVELLIPLEPVAWLFRAVPEAFTSASVFHAQTEMVRPATEHHLATVAAAWRPAIRAAVEKGKGPFLDEQPIFSHLVRNPSGLFLLCPITLRGSQVELQDGLLLTILRALSVDVYAGATVSLEGLSSVGIGRLVRMTRGPVAWVQSALMQPSVQAVIDLRAQNPSAESHTLAERVLALQPPTDGEVNQAHDDIRIAQEQKEADPELRELVRRRVYPGAGT